MLLKYFITPCWIQQVRILKRTISQTELIIFYLILFLLLSPLFLFVITSKVQSCPNYYGVDRNGCRITTTKNHQRTSQKSNAAVRVFIFLRPFALLLPLALFCIFCIFSLFLLACLLVLYILIGKIIYLPQTDSASMFK